MCVALGVAFCSLRPRLAFRITRWNSGSTNHLFGHWLPTMIRCSDSPTSLREARRPISPAMTYPPPGWPTGCLACEPAARNPPCRAASSTSVTASLRAMATFATAAPDGTSIADSRAVIRGSRSRRRVSGFHQQRTHHRIALLRDRSQPLPSARTVLAADSAPGNSPPVCCARTRSTGPIVNTNANDVTGPTPGCVIRRQPAAAFCAACSTAWSSSFTELCSSSNMLQQLLPSIARPRTQPQSFQLGAPFCREQFLLPADALAHGQRVHLVLHRTPHPHQLLPMPDQLPQIPFRRATAARSSETDSRSNRSSTCAASRASVFCLRTTAARIFAASPIHSSCPNSASMASNHAYARWPRSLLAPDPQAQRKMPAPLRSRVPNDAPSTRRSLCPPSQSAGSAYANHNL